LVKLTASIKKFGFTAPVLVDEADFILRGRGRGRVLAAVELALQAIPARVIAGLTETQKRAAPLPTMSSHSYQDGPAPFSAPRSKF
jgi:ParB-like chromosome segregation protein Spo0J